MLGNNKTVNEKDPNIVRNNINMDWLFSLYTFAKVNEDISTALDKRHIEIFKREWYVAWFKANSNQGDEIMRPSILNNEITKRELMRFLIQASDMLLMFKFVGLYYVKDMSNWIEQMSKLDDESLARGLPLPFGVIPMDACGDNTNGVTSDGVTYKSAAYGNYVIYTDQRTLHKKVVFECNDDKRKELYNYEVFDMGADFVSVYDGTIAVPDTTQQMAYNQAKNITTNEMIPSSPFMALYKARSEIEEYITYRGDAAFNTSHPPLFLSAKPMPNSEMEVIPEDVYCAMDTVLGAKQHESLQKQRFAMQSLQIYIDRMNQQNYAESGRHVRPQDLLREQRRTKYGRADNTEGAKAIPGYVDITMGAAPTVPVDIEQLDMKFKYNVAAAVRVPYIFLRSDAHSSGRASSSSGGSGSGSINEETLNFHRRSLYEEMSNEHDRLNQLFRYLYELTYTHLDHFMISRRMEKEEEGGLLPQQQQSDSDEHEKETKKKRKEKQALLASRATQVQKGISVELYFEKPVVRSATAIPLLMQLADRGVVSLEYVAAHVYSVYGHPDEMNMDALPPMPKLPVESTKVTTNAPKAKKPVVKAAEEASTEEEDDDDDDDDKQKQKKKKPVATKEEKKKEKKEKAQPKAGKEKEKK